MTHAVSSHDGQRCKQGQTKVSDCSRTRVQRLYSLAKGFKIKCCLLQAKSCLRDKPMPAPASSEANSISDVSIPAKEAMLPCNVDRQEDSFCLPYKFHSPGLRLQEAAPVAEAHSSSSQGMKLTFKTFIFLWPALRYLATAFLILCHSIDHPKAYPFIMAVEAVWQSLNSYVTSVALCSLSMYGSLKHQISNMNRRCSAAGFTTLSFAAVLSWSSAVVRSSTDDTVDIGSDGLHMLILFTFRVSECANDLFTAWAAALCLRSAALLQQTNQWVLQLVHLSKSAYSAGRSSIQFLKHMWTAVQTLCSASCVQSLAAVTRCLRALIILAKKTAPSSISFKQTACLIASFSRPLILLKGLTKIAICHMSPPAPIKMAPTIVRLNTAAVCITLDPTPFSYFAMSWVYMQCCQLAAVTEAMAVASLGSSAVQTCSVFILVQIILSTVVNPIVDDCALLLLIISLCLLLMITYQV